MNEIDSRILGLYTKMERNEKLSRQLKVLAGVCLFFSVCYCLTTKNIAENIRNLDIDEVVVTNLVWIISIIVLIGIYIKDSYCVKKNKLYELDIYRLRVEDLERKKRIAEIRGEGLPDFVINTKIDVPNEEVSLPIIYYSILLVIDIIIRIILVINKIM